MFYQGEESVPATNPFFFRVSVLSSPPFCIPSVTVKGLLHDGRNAVCCSGWEKPHFCCLGLLRDFLFSFKHFVWSFLTSLKRPISFPETCSLIPPSVFIYAYWMSAFEERPSTYLCGTIACWGCSPPFFSFFLRLFLRSPFRLVFGHRILISTFPLMTA